MSTLWEQERKHTVNEMMQEPKWQAILPFIAAGLNRGVYPKRYLEVLGQKWDGRRYFDIYDAWSILSIDAKIQTGQLAVFQIPIGEVPVKDKWTEEQNRLLSKLNYPFEAEFWGGKGPGADGVLYLDAPVNAICWHPPSSAQGFVLVFPQTYQIRDDDKVYSRAEFPLEVGYTSSAKTWVSLNRAMAFPGLARWPYGHDRITVIASYFHHSQSECFEEYVKRVWGDFHSLPIPWHDGDWDFEYNNLYEACGISDVAQHWGLLD